MADDIEAALTGERPLKPHVDYKGWADNYYSMRDSPASRAAVKYHVNVLRGLAQHKHAIYPPHPPAYLPRNIIVPPDGQEGILKVFKLPLLPSFRAKYPKISPSILLKAATALFLIRKTGHTHALFGHVEAERTKWPFIPKSLGRNFSWIDCVWFKLCMTQMY